ncbi:SH3 domain-containing C40 family peptidase [Anaerococcus nagyae]|uniref:C40 family peptidase n=1 Tax=Anaerococcus nagyae TaxID=1755241 RepID=UPI0032448CEC
MSKSIKKLFLTSLVFSQIFINPSLSHADSIVLNKNITDGVNIRVKEDVNSEILGGIEDFTPYEIKGESDDWYQIEYDGQKAYVAKRWFYKLNHTSIISETNLKEKPDSNSKNLTDYKLKKDSKVTILAFEPDSEFVKVSYDEDFKDNKKINVKNLAETENDSKNKSSDNKSNVKTVTLGSLSSSLEIPEVVTLSSENKDNDNQKDDKNNSKGLKEGYVKLSSLAISTKSGKDLDDFKSFYNDVNNHIKTQLKREEELKNQMKNITEVRYVTTTTYGNDIQSNNQEQTSVVDNSQTITVPVTVSEAGTKLYNWATQFVGRPYVWGGVDPWNGIDCSGFTMQIYRQIGISLPHFAQSQQRYGVEIPLGSEAAGDLVFFGTSLNNITHVGMADGNGNMIHASNPNSGIKISPIRNPISIRRIIQ